MFREIIVTDKEHFEMPITTFFRLIRKNAIHHLN